jgi:hypothetical protein
VAVILGADDAPLAVALVELVNTRRDAVIGLLPEEMVDSDHDIGFAAVIVERLIAAVVAVISARILGVGHDP